MPESLFVAQERRVSNWREAKDALLEINDSGLYVFRGQRCADWSLETSIERIKQPNLRAAVELKALSGFSRGAHRYLSAVPGRDEDLEWLALMQHYGVPTRLLDWTRSPYVAAFFALESELSSGHCAVWAIDYDWCDQKFRDLWMLINSMNSGVNVPLNELIMSNRYPLVKTFEPWVIHERLNVQQGLFIIPGDVTRSFEENLASYEGFSARVWKVVIPNTVRSQALNDLQRMNVNHASLFPGLDGFAQMLRLRLSLWDGKGIVL